MNRPPPRGLFRAALAFAAALLAGCASFDAAEARRNQVGAFSGALQGLADAHLAKPLSLDDCIRVAMTNNHAVRTAELDRQLGRLARDLSFAAFLPQFMAPQGSVIGQSVALGAIFVVIAALSDTAYALAAGWLAPRLNRVGGLRRAGRYLTGGAFIGLGVMAALTGRGMPAK